MNLAEKPAEEFRYIVRIGGTDIDGKKKIPYGLSKIRGIGIRTGEIICRHCNAGSGKGRKTRSWDPSFSRFG
jgi:hypothetical protein